MKTIKKLICLYIISVSCAISFPNSYTINAQAYQKPFRIERIRKRNTFYIIYASRNDSLFKIVEMRNDTLMCNKHIRICRKYKLDLYQLFPDVELFGVPCMLNLGIAGIGMPGGEIVKIDRRTHYIIYQAKNLNGLYLIEK